MKDKELLAIRDRYLELYLSIGEKQAPELLRVAEAYEDWFLREFLPTFQSKASWKEGRLVFDASSAKVINECSAIIEREAKRRVTAKAARWTGAHFLRFYQEGFKLFVLNHQLNGYSAPALPKVTLEDVGVVKGTIALEAQTFHENLGHHVREIARHLHTAMFNGATMTELGAMLTCPDGHIVGYRYGKSRVSWWELMRRYGKNRPLVLAQMALRRRALAFKRSIGA